MDLIAVDGDRRAFQQRGLKRFTESEMKGYYTDVITSITCKRNSPV
jgi:hypothetical protein